MNTSINTINNNPIGFFDSGVGGLTVYSKFRKAMPNENCLYFGDTIHMPYGNKTSKELISYARNILDFFKYKNVKAVVIACNTSSSVAYDVIKDEFDFEIYPIIQCSSKIIAESGAKVLGILATNATVNSGVYEREIKKYNPNIKIYSHGCLNWAKIVETESQYSKDGLSEIQADLNEVLKYNPQKIVLGCTHYPYLVDVMANLFEKKNFIDPAVCFVDYIIQDLVKKGLVSTNDKGAEEIYVSSAPENFRLASKMFYELKSLPKVVDLNSFIAK